MDYINPLLPDIEVWSIKNKPEREVTIPNLFSNQYKNGQRNSGSSCSCIIQDGGKPKAI